MTLVRASLAAHAGMCLWWNQTACARFGYACVPARCTLKTEWGWWREGAIMSGDLPAGVTITFAQQYRRCGKAHCTACRSGPGHGPYWYAYWREGGRKRSRYLGKHVPVLESATAAR